MTEKHCRRYLCVLSLSPWWYLFIIAAISGLLWAGMARASNGASSTKVESLEGALAAVEKAKAERRSQASKELEKKLTPLEKEWGIKLYGLRWTSAGYMLHLKFRVLDSEKAAPLLRRHIKPQVVVEKSGAVLEVPFTAKLGSLRGSVRTANMVKEDHSYDTLFANPGRHVKQGDKVTLVIGNFMAEHLQVQ